MVVAALLAAQVGCNADSANDPSEGTDPSARISKIEAVTALQPTGTVGTPATPAPTVRLTGRNGEPVAGVDVAFVVTGGGGSVAAARVQTDSNGNASVQWTLGVRVTANTITASAGTLTPVVFTAKPVAGPVAEIKRIAGDAQLGVTGSVLEFPLTARAVDTHENPIAEATVTFTVIAGGGTIEGATAVSDSTGLATSGSWTLGPSEGLQTVRAQSQGVQVIFTAAGYECAELTKEQSCKGNPILEHGGTLAFVSERDGNSEIYVGNANGTGVIRLTNNTASDRDPAWSPDGKRIAFTSDRDGSSDIYVMDADGSNVVRLPNTDLGDAPAWSPDGRKIAFSSLRSGQFGIYVVTTEMDSREPAHVGYDRGWNAQPAWSPDGRKIAFVSDWRAFDFLFDVYVMNADGSDIQGILVGPFFWNDGLTFYFQPAWSPDGQKIATVVCGYAWDNCYPNSSIAVANADGSGLKTIAQAGGYAKPTWSPNGSMLAFSSSSCRNCVSSIRYVTADGTKNGLIFYNGHSPSWRP